MKVPWLVWTVEICLDHLFCPSNLVESPCVLCYLALDFFGALRGATYDSQIRDWIIGDVVGTELENSEANLKKLSQRLLRKEGLPTFKPVDITLEMLLKEGGRLAREQQLVNDFKLSEEYMKQQRGSGSLIGFLSS